MRALMVAGVLSAVAFATPALCQATVTYTYDDLSRLSTATYSSKTITYTFDPAGNRIQVATATTTPHAAMRKVSKKKSRKHRSSSH